MDDKRAVPRRPLGKRKIQRRGDCGACWKRNSGFCARDRVRQARCDNVVYKWGLGDEKKYATGVGKQSIQIETSRTPQASHWVRVTVEDIGRTVKKEGTIFITNRDPSVSIYRFSSTGGTEYRSAQTITQIAKGEALTLIAEPYYFPGKKTDILYRWDIGGLAVDGTAENPSLLTIQTEALPAASTLVSLLVSSVKNAALAPITKTISLFIR